MATAKTFHVARVPVVRMNPCAHEFTGLEFAGSGWDTGRAEWEPERVWCEDSNAADRCTPRGSRVCRVTRGGAICHAVACRCFRCSTPCTPPAPADATELFVLAYTAARVCSFANGAQAPDAVWWVEGVARCAG
jgi:hypothetical protein